MFRPKHGVFLIDTNQIKLSWNVIVYVITGVRHVPDKARWILSKSVFPGPGINYTGPREVNIL
jgi:hypothetical protein